MIRQALIRLENYQPHYLGIQVGALMQALEKWADQMEADRAPSRSALPKIRFHEFINS